MRHPLSLALVFSLAFVLAGCGDDSGSGANPFAEGDTPSSNSSPFGGGIPAMPYGIDPSDPDAGTKFTEKLMKSMQGMELNDATLGKLHDFAARLKGAEDNPAKIAALARETGLNMMSYAKAIMKFETLKAALKRGPERAQKQLEEAQKGVAELRERVAKATGEQKQALEQQLKITEMMLSNTEQQAKEALKLEDPAYRSMIEKWAKKFDALDGK